MWVASMFSHPGLSFHFPRRQIAWWWTSWALEPDTAWVRFLDVMLRNTTFLTLMKSNLLLFPFVACAFGSTLKKPRCSYSLHFCNDWYGCTSFHVLICYGLLSLVKCLFMSFAHFKIRLFIFFTFGSFCILDTSPLLDMRFANIFFYSVPCAFVLTGSV